MVVWLFAGGGESEAEGSDGMPFSFMERWVGLSSTTNLEINEW